MSPPALPFGDEARCRRVDLWARTIGQREAALGLSIARSTVSACQRWVDWADGRRRERLANPGNSGRGKLDLSRAREIRRLRGLGVSTVKLGRRYDVRPQTIGKICREILYPEPGAAA